MANFVINLDSDSEQRCRFIQTIRSHIAPLENLTVDERHQNHLSVLWAASPHAPISVAQNKTGLAMIWGEAIVPESPQRAVAAELKATWQYPPGQPYDGFYAGFTYSPIDGLRVGADVMGLFPVYFWAYSGGAVVASSPELLRYHPNFHPKLCLEGLIGVMLLRSLVNDCSLWQGVKRLGAGNLLTVASDGTVAEEAQYRVPCFQADMEKAGYNRLPFEEQVEVLATAVNQAIARHAPATDNQSLLLSGGLDSRTLAGFLDRQGASPQLLTFGRTDDLETLCAKAVAQQLGWPHCIYDPTANLTQQGTPISACVENAKFLTRWGHMAGSSVGLVNTGWHHFSPLILAGRPLISGMAMDRAICGTQIANPCFEKAMAAECKAGGMLPDVARQLLVDDPSIQAKLNGCIAEMHQRYTHYSDLEAQRAWLMSFYHGNRFVLGMAAWRFSFSTWPRLPVLDQKLLAVSGQLPGDTSSQRRAQKEIVRRYFPNLAYLPLDHNAFNIEPLSPSPLRRKLSALIRTQQIWWKLQKRFSHERRSYFRSYDSNRPELKFLRQQAHCHGDKLSGIWDLSVLDKLLPNQSVLSFKKDQIRETKGHLNLIGILLWAGENL